MAPNQCERCSPLKKKKHVKKKKSTGTSTYIVTVPSLAFPYCEFSIYFLFLLNRCTFEKITLKDEKLQKNKKQNLFMINTYRAQVWSGGKEKK